MIRGHEAMYRVSDDNLGSGVGIKVLKGEDLEDAEAGPAARGILLSALREVVWVKSI